MSLRQFMRSAEAWEIIRPFCLSVPAIAVAGVLLAFDGWSASVGLWAVIALIAAQIFIELRSAIRRSHRRPGEVQGAVAEAERYCTEVLWRIVRFVEARDKYLKGHSERVADLAEGIARKMSLTDRQCAEVKAAGRLHDLGMIVVPEKVLLQRQRLAAEGFRTVKRHPDVAYEMLKPMTLLSGALPAIRYHHERMNGTGYPSGLLGQEIPLGARILAVADAYDAMTHDRPHRAAVPPLAAVQELRRCAPEGYDLSCVEALAALKGFEGMLYVGVRGGRTVLALQAARDGVELANSCT